MVRFVYVRNLFAGGKAGARTFTFASLIGCLGGFLGNSYALLAITLIGVFVCFLNIREWRLHQSLMLTTSAALIIIGFCGVLCGKGHTFTPVATAAVFASLTSVLINIPLIARAGGQPRLTKALARTLLIVIASGILGVLIRQPLETAFRSAWPTHETPSPGVPSPK